MDHIRSLEDYHRDIERYLRTEGAYMHNLISLTLRQIDREFGRKAAEQTIEDYQLKKLGLRL